jgi:hypothetical protein
VEIAAAVRAVPKTIPPVLVKSEDDGTELIIAAAFSSGVSAKMTIQSDPILIYLLQQVHSSSTHG